MSERAWPEWWEWEIELSPHLLNRMEDRGFNEVELRRMLTESTRHRPDVVEARWAIETRHAGRRWEVIVEPDADRELLVVVTAFPVWES